jgi:hypothetical protein
LSATITFQVTSCGIFSLANDDSVTSSNSARFHVQMATVTSMRRILKDGEFGRLFYPLWKSLRTSKIAESITLHVDDGCRAIAMLRNKAGNPG